MTLPGVTGFDCSLQLSPITQDELETQKWSFRSELKVSSAPLACHKQSNGEIEQLAG